MEFDMHEKAVVAAPPPTLTVDGRMVATDDEGYLLDHLDWKPQIAEMMADDDGLVLTTDHWVAINFLNAYYTEYEIAPDLYLMQRALCSSKKDCRWTRQYLRDLFPVNGARDACRYAGLPKPRKGACG